MISSVLRELATQRGLAVPGTDALYVFVIDRLTERPEVADVNTSVVYEHIRRPVLEPLAEG
ncbi:MAG: hypothetical protein QOE87_2277 [Gaiellales bacterium]|jgi:hypothetical protein|nr:hypothetical protein [Gaiellales bacterium]